MCHGVQVPAAFGYFRGRKVSAFPPLALTSRRQAASSSRGRTSSTGIWSPRPAGPISPSGRRRSWRSSSGRRCRHEDEPRHLGVRLDGHPVRAGRLPAQWAGETTAQRVRARGGRPRRPDRRLRVPLPAGALRGEPRRGAARRSATTTSTASRAGCTSIRASAAAASSTPTRRRARRRSASPSRRRDFAGELGVPLIVWPGIEGYNYPFQTPYKESWAWFVDGIGEVARDVQGARRRALPRAQELRAGDEDPDAEHRHDAARDPQAARPQGLDNVKVNMDWQHLIMNGENLGRVRRDARGRGPAGPPPRELGLGHVRRRQHGRRDRVHGDARARRRAAPRGLRRRRASGSASTSIRTPRTRSRRCGGASLQWRFIDVGRGEDRRRGAARGADAEGRRRRVRARLRSPRRE